jgi:hypothetical protein
MPDFSVSPGAFSFAVPQFMQYGVGYMQSPSMPRNQPSVYYGQPDLSMGSSGTAVYPQWPTPAMMYPHCYDNLGHVISQVSMLWGSASLAYYLFQHLRIITRFSCLDMGSIHAS